MAKRQQYNDFTLKIALKMHHFCHFQRHFRHVEKSFFFYLNNPVFNTSGFLIRFHINKIVQQAPQALIIMNGEPTKSNENGMYVLCRHTHRSSYARECIRIDVCENIHVSIRIHVVLVHMHMPKSGAVLVAVALWPRL